MTPKQFFERVRVMRQFQKDYFRTRSRRALQQSKALEYEIDTEIERVRRLLNLPDNRPPETPNLFNHFNPEKER